MSILNVNQIQPVGGGNTITVSASDVSASGVTITATSFVGAVTGSTTGDVTGDSPRPTLSAVDNNNGTCTLRVTNPSSTHSFGEFNLVTWDCQITSPNT